jgi:16S rRNA C967 or C1407 C5-methylase (RsmB/RsmF family)/NOL1/NOP2/fmu family ribosome biogenesis protein
MNLNTDFVNRTEALFGKELYARFAQALEIEPVVSIRYNEQKLATDDSCKLVPWASQGRYLPSRPVFTADPLFHAGCYYVQEASSMFVGQVVEQFVEGPVRALDLCAAPGGKSTHLLSLLPHGSMLVSNEPMPLRAQILAENVTKWGNPSSVVTKNMPADFACLKDFFDFLLVDAPCSGEGMFRKDEQAQLQWSEDNVALCEARQRRIVADVWPALAQNGLFIYSTCTFNTRENDGNVRWISEELQAEMLLKEDRLAGMPGVFKTECGYSLVPGFVEGEGQYCSALIKTGISQPVFASRRSGRTAAKVQKLDIPKNVKEMFDRNVSQTLKGDMVIALPEYLKDDVSLLESFLHVIASGCAVGMVKGKDLVPDADLALSLMLKEDAFQVADVDKDTALAFLHRDAIMLSGMEKGYVLIRYEGVNLGFVKNIGNRCNNLHPQSRRIRMNIK